MSEPIRDVFSLELMKRGLLTPDGQVVGGGVVGPAFVPPTRDSLGIEIAVAACVAVGGGTVVYEAADYTITQDHTLVKNVSHVGVKPRLVFSGDVPDANFSTEGGTRFIVSPGVTCFKYNNAPRVTEEENIAEASLPGVKLYGLTFIGGARAVDIGAYLAMGATYGEFDELYAFDQTSDFAFNFVNFQHCEFGRLYTSTNLTAGSGVRLASALSATLLPGNSTIRAEIYTYCKHRRNRSVVIEAFGPSGCVLNQMKVAGRLQGNRYGAAAPTDISMSFTSGSPNIVVANAAQFDLMQIDMPVAFETAVAGYSIRTVYFVRTRDPATNTITLAETPYATSSINATATATGTAKCSGYPSIEIVGRAGCAINHSDFGLIDAEAFGNVCAVLIAKTRRGAAHIAEIMSSATGTALACRDAEMGITYARTPNLTMDESALWGWVRCTNLASGPHAYSGGSFTLDPSWHGHDLRYTGTTDITITVPNNLPKGFSFSITPTSSVSRNVTTTAGSATATMSDTSGVVAGASVSGNANIPAGTRVASVTNGTTVELTAAATGSASGVATAFGQGVVTFAASSGGSIRSRSGLRTNGLDATARLENIANRVYRLTGDLQV